MIGVMRISLLQLAQIILAAHSTQTSMLAGTSREQKKSIFGVV